MNRQRFAVAVPARNEDALLPRLLDSLANNDVDWRNGHLVVVANNCSDRTASVANAFAPRLPITVIEKTFPAEQAHVGTARKLALDEASDWLARRGDDGVLLTTDADAVVPPDWIARNLDALGHCDIAGGRLVADHADAENAGLQTLIDRYWSGVRWMETVLDPQPHDPPPRHGDHTGGSLAFHAVLYRRLGGLTPLPVREDVDFVDRALRAGARLAHPIGVSVTVSTRVVGRAEGGMASEMARRQSLQCQDGAYLVPHPAIWETRISARARLRKAWQNKANRVEALHREGITGGTAACVLEDCPNDIAYVERASAAFTNVARAEIPIGEAIRLMDAWRPTITLPRLAG